MWLDDRCAVVDDVRCDFLTKNKIFVIRTFLCPLKFGFKGAPEKQAHVRANIISSVNEKSSESYYHE